MKPEAIARDASSIRRGLLGAAVLLPAACSENMSASSVSPGQLTYLDPGDIPDRSELGMPQVLMGPARAPVFTEVAYSLHCGASRAWLRANFPALARACNAGRKQAMLSHLARTGAEIEMGAEILAAGESAYPEALMAVTAFTLAEDRPLSAAEVRAFLPAAGYPQNGRAGKAAYATAMRVVRGAYEGLGVRGTPYVKERRKG